MKDITLEVKLLVRVTSYDVYLDEINAWSPLINFIPVKVKYILNWLNNKLDVEFKNKEDEEHLFLFLKQYNMIAKIETERAKKLVYPIPDVAEEELVRSLKLKLSIIKKKEEKDTPNPFKPKKYATVQTKTSPSHLVKKKVIAKGRPKMYEMFANMPSIDVPHIKEQSLDDIDLTQ
jgi:hypothetical protein